MYFLTNVRYLLCGCLFFAVSTGSSHVFAQRVKAEDAFAWYSQSLTIPIGKKWAIQEDGSVRWYGLSRNVSFLTLRAGIEYKWSPLWSVTMGYTFFDQFKDMPGLQQNRAEHRPYQQVLFRKAGAFLTTVQRFRVEERFFSERLQEGRHRNYHFFRLRYMSSLQVNPIKKGFFKSLYFIAQAEVMIHAGDAEFVVQAFDQYRFYPHLGWKATPNLDFQAGYMYYFQINPANTQELEGHTLRLSVFYILRRPQKAQPDEE